MIGKQRILTKNSRVSLQLTVVTDKLKARIEVKLQDDRNFIKEHTAFK